MPTPPPKPSFAKLALDALRDLFVGLFVQLGRGVALLFRKGQRSTARRTATAAAIRLGERMAETEMGNPLLVREAVGAGKRERPAAMEQLGQSGLEVGVPPLGLEGEYADGRAARDAVEEVEASHRYLVTNLWASSLVGWVALGVNYVAVAFGLLLLWAWLAPASAPGFVVSLITKPTPPPPGLPTATIDGLEVMVTKVVLGRQELKGNTSGKTVVVMDDSVTLTLSVTLTNSGPTAVRYRTWRGVFNSPKDDAARLVDHRGMQVGRMVFKFDAVPDGGVGDVTIEPGRSVSDVLVFAPPEPKFQSLDLFLPGENVGRAGTTKLIIPAGAVDKPENY